MCKVAEIVVSLFLMIAAYKDWRTKRISVLFLFVMSVVMLGVRFLIMIRVSKDTLFNI